MTSKGKPSTGQRYIRIDLSAQKLYAYDGAQLVHAFDCVSGDKRHPTDRGTFKIYEKAEEYTSHRYRVPMNYAMFFTTDKKAIHQYHGPAPWAVLKAGRAVTDWVGSHGCVRLKEDDAKALFHWTPLFTEICIS